MQVCILPQAPSPATIPKLKSAYEVPEHIALPWIPRFEKMQSQHETCDLELSALYHLLIQFQGPNDEYEPLVESEGIQKLRYFSKFKFSK